MITQPLVCDCVNLCTPAWWALRETSRACYCEHLREGLTLCPAPLWAHGWLPLPPSPNEHWNRTCLEHTWPAAEMVVVDVCILGAGTQTRPGWGLPCGGNALFAHTGLTLGSLEDQPVDVSSGVAADEYGQGKPTSSCVSSSHSLLFQNVTWHDWASLFWRRPQAPSDLSIVDAHRSSLWRWHVWSFVCPIKQHPSHGWNMPVA